VADYQIGEILPCTVISGGFWGDEGKGGKSERKSQDNYNFIILAT
jgi:adenylosuccinate synthase